MAYSIPTLRPMGVGDLLDETIRVYRRHFLVFVGIGAVLWVPMAVLQLVPQTLVHSSRLAPDTGSLGSATGLAWIINLLSGLAYIAFELAITCAVSEAYLGRRPTLGAAYSAGLRRFRAAVGLSFLVLLLGGLLAVTLVGIPFSIYYGVGWIVAVQALLLEGLGIRGAMGRSRALVRGNWWRVCGITTLLLILQLVLQMVFSVPAGVVGVFALDETSQFAFTMLSVVGALMGTAAQVIGGPIWFIGLVLLYYDLRIRQEGFDLELLGQQMEVAARTGAVPS
jgi:hypothetical protein